MSRYYIGNPLQNDDKERLGDLVGLLAPPRSGINSYGLGQQEPRNFQMLDPFSGRTEIVEYKIPSDVSIDKAIRSSGGKFESSPFLGKEWWRKQDTVGFDRLAVISSSDPRFLDYFIYEGPDYRLSDKLFILEDSTKGKYAFIKDIDSGNLYSVEKSYLKKPKVRVVAPTNKKVYGGGSEYFYKNRYGELTGRNFKVIRSKEPLDPSAHYSSGRQISVVKKRINKGIDKTDNSWMYREVK
jgi:hypothetical protein